jgi:hypothetical protein
MMSGAARGAGPSRSLQVSLNGASNRDSHFVFPVAASSAMTTSWASAR